MPGSFFCLIWAQLLYNVLLVSLYNEVNQLYLYICPLLLRLPSHPPIPPRLDHHRTWGWVPWSIQQLPTSYFTQSVYMSILTSHFIPPSPPSPSPCLHARSLRLCPYACPQIGSPGSFFEILHICMYRRYLVFSFWLIHYVWQTRALQNCQPSVRDIHVQECRSIQGFSRSLCKMKFLLSSGYTKWGLPHQRGIIIQLNANKAKVLYFFLLPKIPWTEEPGGLQSTGRQKVTYDWACTHELEK